MAGEEPILPTAEAGCAHAMADTPPASSTKSREPTPPAGETGAGAVTVSVAAPPVRADAPSHQPAFEEVAP